MKNILYYFQLLFLTHNILARVVDYFDTAFDKNKNCKHEEKMETYGKQGNRCIIVSKGSDAYQWQQCLNQLSTKLNDICNALGIKKTGDLLYCKARGRTSCCFEKEECVKNYNIVNDAMVKRALFFMENTPQFLDNWMKKGQDTCHKIDGYDVSQCHRDCKLLEKSDFAQDCEKDGGLFKCCIRRDKEFCHECRYCCTLSICTTKDGTKFKYTDENYDKALKNGTSISRTPTAGFGYTAEHMSLYKKEDYRCLKPKEGIPSKKWPYYEMKGHRKAKTKDEMKKVEEIPFDKYFFNFEDPKVFKDMTKSSHWKNLKLWKRTYGFDFLSRINGRKSDGDLSPCHKHCLKAEYGKWAKKCKEGGGIFKCCIYATRLDQFDAIRYELRKRKLVNHGPKQRQCGDYFGHGNCHHCSATHVCAKQDPMTGFTVENFQTKLKPQHKIGGRHMGFKYSTCFTVDSCKNVTNHGRYQNIVDYSNAASKSQFCNLTLAEKFVDLKKALRPEKQREWKDACMKSGHPNVFICPNRGFFKYHEENLTYVTENKVLTSPKLRTFQLRKLEKKLKKTKKKKKPKKRTPKEKNQKYRKRNERKTKTFTFWKKSKAKPSRRRKSRYGPNDYVVSGSSTFADTVIEE